MSITIDDCPEVRPLRANRRAYPPGDPQRMQRNCALCGADISMFYFTVQLCAACNEARKGRRWQPKKITAARPQRTCAKCPADITMRHGSAKLCAACFAIEQRRQQRVRRMSQGISDKAVVTYMEMYTPNALEKIKAQIRRIRLGSTDSGVF